MQFLIGDLIITKKPKEVSVCKLSENFFALYDYPSEAQEALLQAYGILTACPADTLSFFLSVENIGVAPIYNKIPLKLRLQNGKRCFDFDTGIDIRQWLPGKHENSFQIQPP